MDEIDPSYGYNLGQNYLTTLHDFNNARHGFYDWLAMQVYEMNDFDDIHQDLGDRLDQVSSCFMNNSLSIYDEGLGADTTSRYIANNWFSDETERVALFYRLAKRDTFQTIEVNERVILVGSVLRQLPESAAGVKLRQIYKEELSVDVAWLLGKAATDKKMLIETSEEVTVLPGLEAKRHFLPVAPYFHMRSIDYANFVLKSLLS